MECIQQIIVRWTIVVSLDDPNTEIEHNGYAIAIAQK